MGVSLGRDLRGGSVQSLYIMLPGYTKITLILSTSINNQPVFFFSLCFFSWKRYSQLMSELLDNKKLAIKQEMLGAAYGIMEKMEINVKMMSWLQNIVGTSA